ncbi:GTP cyclohydrolase I/Nitrile oxidoreductase [Paludibacter propionicigenes WB4]|uniref:GTP cyclohydrolase I/Nitrile oxidoreductase n=1 Tax=Paludibacter propionicigenes (strain DSM 17365 / JCM 13257 / WB4) TaxID=694427 RepID=E4T438_PALPW|nr:NADPH-dependent 7-cyano-7-deazaguanine reductase QueF [Paludibacter propionicigenes]ADQ79482.1 GTP cyclohydrolase I/Nitrile oxidoreductase [Paludibacter propionicigenes WB4]
MDFNLKDSLLGKQSSTPETYDASLLFRIPRSENRVRYAIEDEHLPFVGFDVWNCYELSFLTDNGLPVSRVLKLVYPASGQFLVESKSLKLYLNAFNMDRFGKTIAIAESRVADLIRTDLSRLLETDVQVSLFGSGSAVGQPFQAFDGVDLCSQIPESVQESIAFTRFVESPDLLRGSVSDVMKSYVFRTDLLRSNCRVTNQPDWGDLFVSMSAQRDVDLSSVMEYLVSFRKENHFHEEVVEMIYKRFWDIFAPESLMVAAMYTRRGGIDINPIRASHSGLIDKILVDGGLMTAKTWRQ